MRLRWRRVARALKQLDVAERKWGASSGSALRRTRTVEHGGLNFHLCCGVGAHSGEAPLGPSSKAAVVEPEF
jgi:hypothetical protein